MSNEVIKEQSKAQFPENVLPQNIAKLTAYSSAKSEKAHRLDLA